MTGLSGTMGYWDQGIGKCTMCRKNTLCTRATRWTLHFVTVETEQTHYRLGTLIEEGIGLPKYALKFCTLEGLSF